MDKIVLCDLDGTLSDAEHRVHHVRAKRRDYESFFAAAGKDAPVEPVITLVRTLAAQGHQIHIVSGRRDDTCAATERSLEELGAHYHRLLLSTYDDRTPVHILKKRWFDSDYHGYDAALVLEDLLQLVSLY